mgnify:FL=1
MQVSFDTFVANLHSMIEFNPSVLAAPVQDSRRQQDEWQKVSARIAHGLKEPIRNLSSCAKLLADLNEGADVGLDQATLCDWLRESADRAQDMIEAILKLSLHGKEESKTEVDLNRIVEDIQHDLTCPAKNENAMSLITSCNLPVVNAGAWGMRTVLQNLIENACKHGQPGATNHVWISSEGNAHDGWIIRCKDKGLGMTQEQIEQATMPYQRCNPGAIGLGMGLYLVQQIVAEHGGELTINSEPHQGTEVSFTMPA